jgi:hypothetical protein
MTNYAKILWNAPQSKTDCWLLRSGLILLVSSGVSLLVSGVFVLWFGFIAGAILSLLGLAESLRKGFRAALSRIDGRYMPHTSYRAVRWIVSILVLVVVFIGGIIFEIVLTVLNADSNEQELSYMGDMPLHRLIDLKGAAQLQRLSSDC